MSVVSYDRTGTPEGLLADRFLGGGTPSSFVQADTETQRLLSFLRRESVGTGGQLTGFIVYLFIGTGGSPVSQTEPRSRKSRIESPAEQVALIRSALSLNIRELAMVLHVERPTVYSWISGAQPREANARRLRTLTSLARKWNTLSTQPLGNLRKDADEDGISILTLLEEDPLDTDRVLGLFKAAAAKLRAQPRPGIGLAARAKKRGVVLAEPPDAQREIDRLTGKRIAPE